MFYPREDRVSQTRQHTELRFTYQKQSYKKKHWQIYYFSHLLMWSLLGVKSVNIDKSKTNKRMSKTPTVLNLKGK